MDLVCDPFGSFTPMVIGPVVRLTTIGVAGDDGKAPRVELPLTSGEARVLARQLVHLADLHDIAE